MQLGYTHLQLLVTFILKAITPATGVIQGNIGYGFLIAYLLKTKRVQLSEGADINSQAYLFRTLIKETKKKDSKKITTAATE